MIALLLLAIALSMDAFAVAIGLGAKHRQDTTKIAVMAGVYFGVFQGLMPLIGYLGGRSILGFIANWAPWIACMCGWFVAEYGRQPWTVFGMLPTHMSTSSVSAGTLWASLAGFVIFYTVLLVVEIYLMLKYARMGPAALQADHT